MLQAHPGPARHAPLLVFAVALASFARFAAPGVGFDDSGELAAAAVTTGVPHPPGFPGWVLLSKLWLLLAAPLGGDPARLLSLLSASCAAGAAALLARTALARGAGFGPALGAGVLPCMAPTFAHQALICEVYAPAAFLQMALVAHALGERPRAGRAGLLLGLGACVHPGSLFGAPLVLLAALRAREEAEEHEPTMLAQTGRALLGLGIGLLPYLYVPWAARREPLLSWGDARGGQRLLDHLLRTQFSGEAVATHAERLRFLAEELLCQWPLLLLVCALGIPYLLRSTRARRASWALTSCILLGSLVLYTSNRFALEEPSRWRLAGAHTPLVVYMSALCMLSLVALERRMAPSMPRVRTSPLWPLLALLLANSWRPSTLSVALDQSGAHAAERYATEALEACAPESVLLISRAGYGDVLHFPLMYAQLVKHERTDVLLIDRDMLGMPWYREQLARAEPRLAEPLDQLASSLADPRLAGDPRSRRLANLPFIHSLFDGPRPVAVLGSVSQRLLDGRRALADHALWHVAARSGARAGLDPRAGRDRERPGGTWLPSEDTDPWIAELRKLYTARERAR